MKNAIDRTLSWNAQTARMRAKFPYLVSDAAVCPRVVAGKRCLRRHHHIRHEDCICDRAQKETGLMDHARIWRDRDLRHVLTSEPYGVNAKDLATFRVLMDELGLTVTVEDWSAWNPGQCTLITVTRNDA